MRPSRLIVVVALLLLAASSATAATVTQEIDRTVALAAGGEVVLENVNGSITVDTWDRDEVRLHVEKKVKAGSRSDAEEVMERFAVKIRAESDRLEVEAESPREGSGFFGWLLNRNLQYSASYRLTVPRRAHLEATTVNGTVDVSGIEGRLVVSTVNGGVRIDGVTGDTEVSTVNGRVKVADARGSVSASTVNGGVDVELRRVDRNADMSFSTVNGGVSLALPADVATRLDARTSNGGISTDFPVEVERRHGRKSLRAELNGGGGDLEVRTTNGGISIHKL
jgi:DUF4097 and DUF4098 domain-containing protein YvlB